MPRKEHNMDVRETTELDEDERIITIADGSDTGIVNNQVPEADIIRYKDSTYEIVSKIAYLIGVPKRIFENEHEPPKMEVYERLEQGGSDNPTPLHYPNGHRAEFQTHQ